MDAEAKPLSEKQRRFVEEYVCDPNKVQSYFRAYGRYYTNGAGKKIRRSYKAASVQAHRLLETPRIQAEILAARRESARRCRVTADRVIRELIALAFSDPADVVDTATNEPLPLEQMSVAARKSIASIEIERRRVLGDDDVAAVVEKCKIKQHDKGINLDRLAKHLGLYAENNALESILGQLPGALRQQVVAALALGRTKPAGGESDGGDRPLQIGGSPD